MRRVRVAKAARAHAVRDCLSDRSSRRCALGHLGPFALGGPEPEAVPAPPPPLPEPVPRRRWTRFAPGQMRHLQGGADARRDHCAGQPRPAESDLSRNTVLAISEARHGGPGDTRGRAARRQQRLLRPRTLGDDILPNRSSTRTTSSPTTSCRVRNLRWSSAPLRANRRPSDPGPRRGPRGGGVGDRGARPGRGPPSRGDAQPGRGRGQPRRGMAGLPDASCRGGSIGTVHHEARRHAGRCCR